MNRRILHTADAAAWTEALETMPKTDVYFTAAYHRAFEANGDGEGVAFLAEEGGKRLFYPFMLRAVPSSLQPAASDSWHDIETVYGYSGPLTNTDDEEFLGRAWVEFAAWCRTSRVVAEFVRFNPLIRNDRACVRFMDTSVDRETVVLRLDRGSDALWGEYTSIHRNMVRKAQRKGLVCELDASDAGYAAFHDLYARTMQRVQAGECYFFSMAWLKSIREGLDDALRLFTVRDGERVVSAGLFMVHGKYLHYHLSGSDETYREAAPNNLLLHTAAEWGAANGLAMFHLGGGRTSSPDDSLMRFKASISRERAMFVTGRRVQDAAKYDELCSRWMNAKGATARPSYFLMYRLALP